MLTTIVLFRLWCWDGVCNAVPVTTANTLEQCQTMALEWAHETLIAGHPAMFLCRQETP